MKDKEKRIREMEYPEFVRFRTFNLVNSKGKIVMASIKEIDNCGNKISVSLGFAFCSPRDSFWRKKGKFIAAQRLLTKPIGIHQADRESIIDAMFQEANRIHTPWMKNITKDMIR